jgi:hypothetical protein
MITFFVLVLIATLIGVAIGISSPIIEGEENQ